MRRGMPWSRRSVVVALCGVVAACAPGRKLPMLPDPGPGAYQLGAGDQIRVITFGAEQLSGTYRIDDTGGIAIPLLGTVQASGKSPAALARTLEAELRQKKLIDRPSVAVQIEAFRPVFILGEVARPGPYPFQPGMTVLTAVSVAGGFTYRAFDDYASVVRTEGDHAVEGRVARQSLVQPGDVITIFERHF